MTIKCIKCSNNNIRPLDKMVLGAGELVALKYKIPIHFKNFRALRIKERNLKIALSALLST